MSDLIERLRNPPIGTETSERNLMLEAANEIERLNAKNKARLKNSQRLVKASKDND